MAFYACCICEWNIIKIVSFNTFDNIAKSFLNRGGGEEVFIGAALTNIYSEEFTVQYIQYTVM